MKEPVRSRRILRFAVFEADLDARELRKGGTRVRLQEQPFRILELLTERAGDVVTREELHQKLWPEGTFVDFDRGLHSAINKLREALGDSADSPRYIETIPRRGYRFLAAIEHNQGPPLQDTVGLEVGSERASTMAKPARLGLLTRRPTVPLLTAALVSALVGAVLWIHAPSPQPEFKAVPLTSYPGYEYSPSFSPDGSQIAFVWNRYGPPNLTDIYIKQVGEERVVPLTSDRTLKGNPVWSPDGRFIAFLRKLTTDKVGIFLVSPIGGVERRVIEVSGQIPPFEDGSVMCWTPDSRSLIVRNSFSLQHPPGLSLVFVATGEMRKLTSPPAESAGDVEPTVSPDGRSLAFTRWHTPQLSSIYVQALSDGFVPQGHPQELTSEDDLTYSPAWTADSRDLVYCSGVAPLGEIWRKRAWRRAKPERLPYTTGACGHVAISRGNPRLTFLRVKYVANLWRTSLSASDTVGSWSAFAASTICEFVPQISPDGHKVAFASYRSGGSEIWIANSDGSGAVQLTDFKGPLCLAPRWSPDGGQIAFEVDRSRKSEIWVVNATGGVPRKLFSDGAFPSWSRDGHWMYFTSHRSGRFEIWKRLLSDPPVIEVQITKQGGFTAFNSVDGRFIYYAKGRMSTSIWRASITGGDETEITESLSSHSNFDVGKRGIYFIPDPDSQGRSSFRLFEFATGKPKTLATTTKEIGAGLAVSPDESWMLSSQVDRSESDLMLVDGFR